MNVPQEVFRFAQDCHNVASPSHLSRREAVRYATIAFQKIQKNLDLSEEFIERDDLRPSKRPTKMLERLLLPFVVELGRIADDYQAPRIHR